MGGGREGGVKGQMGRSRRRRRQSETGSGMYEVKGELTYGRTQSSRRGATRTFGGYMRQL